ncbi:hypothetical protein [Paenibacillus silviterrae]|uniref:hypothetical protein n=1 Tax=Paenibacillus silviterrae TaxID=3242194 RepID=UPI002543A654|nr:hypothetical protein [Paenibacillus chinjuensis]
MTEQIFALSRLSRLDVKWAKPFRGSMVAFNEIEHYNPFFELLAVFEGPIYLQAGQVGFADRCISARCLKQ